MVYGVSWNIVCLRSNQHIWLSLRRCRSTSSMVMPSGNLSLHASGSWLLACLSWQMEAALHVASHGGACILYLNLVWVWVCARECVRVCVRVCVYVCACVGVNVSVHVWVCMVHACEYVCMFACMSVCMCACVHVWVWELETPIHVKAAVRRPASS